MAVGYIWSALRPTYWSEMRGTSSVIVSLLFESRSSQSASSYANGCIEHHSIPRLESLYKYITIYQFDEKNDPGRCSTVLFYSRPTITYNRPHGTNPTECLPLINHSIQSHARPKVKSPSIFQSSPNLIAKMLDLND